MLFWLIGVVIAVLLLAIIIVFILHCLVNDKSVKGKAWKASQKHIVLAVFAHPDDEVMVCGTLAKLKSSGNTVHSLYLTHGEDGPTGNIVEKKDLGPYREKELQEVKKHLQLDSLEILNYPDRYLNTISQDVIKQEIVQRIEKYNPDTVICFDTTIGLYGHTDHVMAGQCVQNLLSEKSFNVKHLLIMTLPKQMINLAMKVSKTFKERYNVENGLPDANLCVKISNFAKQKYKVVSAHKTQWQVMRDVQPLLDKIPYLIYYRIFSREYYHYKCLK